MMEDYQWYFRARTGKRPRRRRPLVRFGTWAMRILKLGSKLSFEELRCVVEEYEAKIPHVDSLYDRISCPVMLVVGRKRTRCSKAKRSEKPCARASEPFAMCTPRRG